MKNRPLIRKLCDLVASHLLRKYYNIIKDVCYVLYRVLNYLLLLPIALKVVANIC